MGNRWYAIAFAAALVAGCNNQVKDGAVPQAVVSGESLMFPAGSQQLNAIVTEAAVERPAPAVMLNGRLTWNEDKTVRIYTPFAGRVSRILVQPGDRVSRGQTLAVIASPDFGQAQAEARRAQGDYSLAQQNLARVMDLHAHGVAAAKELDAAKADFARTESELQRTQARLKLYGGGMQIDQTYALTSPLAGVVVERNINPGQELRPDQMGSTPALFTITDPSSLWAVLDAAEKDLAHLKLGGVVKIHVPAYPDIEFKAVIAAVSDFLDPATRTIKVRAAIDNTQRKLKGEMFVTGSVKSSSDNVLQVPSRAVFFQGGRHILFVERDDGAFARQEVKIGDGYEGKVTILSGLQPGQKVVTEGALLLQQMLQPRRVMN